jgi:hypothetical protein
MNLKSLSLDELHSLLATVQAEIPRRLREPPLALPLPGRLTLGGAYGKKKQEVEIPHPVFSDAKTTALPPESPSVLPNTPMAEGVAKYRHPTHRDLSWDGQGPTPEWVGVWLSSGRSLDALAVAAEKRAPRVLPPSFLQPPRPPQKNTVTAPAVEPSSPSPSPEQAGPAQTPSNTPPSGQGGGYHGHYARRRRHLRTKDHQ